MEEAKTKELHYLHLPKYTATRGEGGGRGGGREEGREEEERRGGRGGRHGVCNLTFIKTNLHLHHHLISDCFLLQSTMLAAFNPDLPDPRGVGIRPLPPGLSGERPGPAPGAARGHRGAVRLLQPDTGNTRAWAGQAADLGPDFESAERLHVPQPSLARYDKAIQAFPTGQQADISSPCELQLSYNRIVNLHPALFAKLRSLESLYLEHNELRQLPKGLFRWMSDVSEIDLSDNHLSSLPPSVFLGLGRVSSLRLSHNNLSSLHSDQFRDLIGLKDLMLDGNHICELPVGLFTNLANLTTLHLDNNCLSELSPDVFVGLTSLKELRLNFNQLCNIPFNTFHVLHDLRKLLLKNNSLDSLQAGLFVWLSKLEELNLDGNKLHHLQADVFHGLTNLQKLSLKSNQLRAVENGALEPLRKLSDVRLSGNLWDCSSAQVLSISCWVNTHRERLRDQPLCYVSSSSPALTEEAALSHPASPPLLLGDNCAANDTSSSKPLFPLEMLTLLMMLLVAVRPM
ncbi:unnamed protein product [Pleuronectes platessa]|uniref:Uncharacterized protein n=1 Tax=Pleuronectes platessa TaxID=8262 RepID=A0A9N7UFZ8_PLEPL|nr:unnamed protein product [Pleuronectes platessa]